MKSKSVKIIIIFLVLSVFPLFSAYSNDKQQSTDIEAINQDQRLRDALKGVSAKKAMLLANKWRLEKINIVSFVTPDAVNFKFRDGKTLSISLPDDEMIVSVAPYIKNTHECATHYMSSCDGELKNKLVKIKAVTAKGKILINKIVTMPRTGFYDLWLPRDQEITISVDALGKKATGKIFTNRNSKTCDTTLKLE